MKTTERVKEDPPRDATGSAVCPDCSATLRLGLVLPDSQVQCGECGAVLTVRLEPRPIRAEDLR